MKSRRAEKREAAYSIFHGRNFNTETSYGALLPFQVIPIGLDPFPPKKRTFKNHNEPSWSTIDPAEFCYVAMYVLLRSNYALNHASVNTALRSYRHDSDKFAYLSR